LFATPPVFCSTPTRINTKTGIQSKLQGVRHIALDLDGTLYRGSTLFPDTQPFLLLLAQLGIGHTFITNNPSKSVDDYLKHLESFGLHATADNLYTSAQATIEYLRSMRPPPRHLFILVLTGETTAAQAASSDIPDIVVPPLAEIGAMLREVK
jgi:ribonucleotide monophosphatase NagD (HAD superfamily)